MCTLEGKTALVTGAARGIGRAVAEHLAGKGADLAICDLKEEWLADTAEAIRAKGRKVECLAADVSKSEDVAGTVDKVVEVMGGIDILVNNAGITKDGLMVRMSEEDWDAVISVNLRGTFLFTKAAARPMMKKRSGAIINIASIIGLIGNAGQCNYAASKAGVIALTKSAAKELAGRGVRVNAVAPGFIESKMTEVLSEDVQNSMLAVIPMKRFGKPEDIAKAVGFLAGEGSSYITGQVLTVSGGMVM
ncbi:MAG: 3-oxoacyl-[acyl-carrier-protein] reductase [Kiritimatiellia bacterium]|jgi:3-oxoacyl-[acyl-carrier protein] reductase|nr:3-oxoacyl-[acyl-carrier-protein] reductase [Kiritimatiellia bacterium]MDP6848422.1 3-oxoacyl-[acyl-carrier-protein] reductase [Kiritimatiellia bacterium]